MTRARLFRIARLVAMWLVWGLVAIGLTLRLTVRDRYFPWAMIYYLTPIPSLPIWTFVAAIVGSPMMNWRRNRDSTLARFRLTPLKWHLLLGLIFAIWTLQSEFVFRAKPVAPGDLRIVFWNVARIFVSVNRLASQLKSYNAPVIALTEADKDHQLNVKEWQSELPEYQVIETRWGGLVAVKGQVISNRERELSTSCYCQQLELHIDGVEFTLLLVDITSDLTRSRRQRIDSFVKLAEEVADRPTVIVGDFNTPDDSVWFAPLRRRYRQAFRERGFGYAATWPMPLPVLTLDQVWVNEFVDVSRCQVGWTVYSDHRPVVSDLTIRAWR